MKRILVVLALVLSSMFIAPAAADTPGPQSKCLHENVGPWYQHFWVFDSHYLTRDWYGNYRHVHVWRHYIQRTAGGYFYYDHTSSTYC